MRTGWLDLHFNAHTLHFTLQLVGDAGYLGAPSVPLVRGGAQKHCALMKPLSTALEDVEGPLIDKLAERRH